MLNVRLESLVLLNFIALTYQININGGGIQKPSLTKFQVTSNFKPFYQKLNDTVVILIFLLMKEIFLSKLKGVKNYVFLRSETSYIVQYSQFHLKFYKFYTNQFLNIKVEIFEAKI